MNDAKRLVSALLEQGWTLGIAESLTGGALASEVVSVPGSSGTLLGAVVAYATPVKATLLGVEESLLDEHGPVHARVAEQMAEGVRSCVAVEGRVADVGVSTTGIAGPASPDGQPVGTVHIGVAGPFGTSSERFVFSGGRAEIREQTVQSAIALLLRSLEEYRHGNRGC
ncbi:CinA family protein [uncultured Microbacterium sp.]|uniref:CinA family protein n=1 Tax=uncultured Microbacterium sp. TaxID=191216 RepID=UPI00262CD91F|nr:CinA family protein [uncultured Microbacterium sp.]